MWRLRGLKTFLYPQKAIYEYAEKVKKKSRLMSFAGILGEKDADDLLKVIQESRTDKQLEIRI